MGKKYSVGDKVVTADNWNDGMGRIIPKGSVVEIIRDFEYGGINMYDCEYNGGRCIYEEQWLGDKYVNPKIGGWIPCNERLPEEWEDVMICYYNDREEKHLSDIACLDDNGCWQLLRESGGYFPYNFKKKITHWRPLPNLPEEYHG